MINITITITIKSKIYLIWACIFSFANAANAANLESYNKKLEKIKHIIVIYAENRSFDSLYSAFSSKNDKDSNIHKQLDFDNTVLPYLPKIWNDKSLQNEKSNQISNAPFSVEQILNKDLNSKIHSDPVHKFYQNQEQINGGKNNKFAAISNAGALTMGYFNGESLPLFKRAKQFTLADNFFMGAFGGSFLNHQYLICACAPKFDNAPAKLKVILDDYGKLKRTIDSPKSALIGHPKYVQDGSVSPDGFAINTLQPPYQPSWIKPKNNIKDSLAFVNNDENPLPAQTSITIGDTLSEKNISWAWYAQGWNKAIADGMQDPDKPRSVIYNDKDGAINFQPHHQPFNYYSRFSPHNLDERAKFLKDGDDFMDAINNDMLPQVSFYKPQGSNNQHPEYTNVMNGDMHIDSVVDKIMHSKVWKDSVIIISYDENGGFWDHVAPPIGDKFGPGNRIPTIIISPFAKKNYVDHTMYDTTSIIKFITLRFGLKPLSGVRKDVGDLTNALNLD
jgi:acid phosphatase